MNIEELKHKRDIYENKRQEYTTLAQTANGAVQAIDNLIKELLSAGDSDATEEGIEQEIDIEEHTDGD